ncbi:MAG: hypothetical protein K2N11_01760 [Mucispirillum sp.]|nr:hypothetical protein [Mucispirillum sp.]
MESKGKLIDKILKEFLSGEAEATDMRIISIRHFLSALNNAVDKYVAESQDTENNEDKKLLVVMLDDMAEIYCNEISDLLVKRGKLQHYLEMFHSEYKHTVKTSKQLIKVKESQSNYIN